MSINCALFDISDFLSGISIYMAEIQYFVLTLLGIIVLAPMIDYMVSLVCKISDIQRKRNTYYFQS